MSPTIKGSQIRDETIETNDIKDGTLEGQDFNSTGSFTMGALGLGSSPTSYRLEVAGDAGFNEYLYHNGDADTFIRFQDDDITIKAGNVNFINFASGSQNKLIINDSRDDLDFIVRSPSETLAVYLNAANEVFHINHGESNFKTKIHSLNGEAMTVNDSGVIFNEDGHSSNDLRVESNSDTHLFYIDSSADKIGVSTSSPDCTLHVAGALAASGPSKTFQTFTNGDYSPSLANGNLFKTYDGAGQGATSLDDGVAGQIVTIISTNGFTYMVSGGNLKAGTTDISTAAGDVTTWIFDGTYWYLINFMDQSADLSGGH